MADLLTKLRWLLFLPIGYLSGCIVWGFTLGFGSFYGSNPTRAAFVCTITAALFPAVGYRIGRWIAPSERQASRWLLLALIGIDVVLGLVGLAWLAFTGESFEISHEFMPVLSPRWCTVLESVGLLGGWCWAYRFGDPERAPSHRDAPASFSSFDLAKASFTQQEAGHEGS